MTILSIDVETYSDIDLRSAGVYAYTEDPSFEILLFSFAFDDDYVTVLDLTQDEIPAILRRALKDPEIIKSAYNANFERTCLAAHLGIPMPPEQWSDTMIIAAQMGLPRTLADVGRVLGLPEDQQKMREGRNLIQYFSKPCKPTKANGMRVRNLPQHAPDRWLTYKEYNKRDVETEREIRRRLLRHQEAMTESEQALWCIDQAINDRGVMIDRTFVSNAAQMDRSIKDDLKAEAKQISGLDNPNSVAQIKRWIQSETGVLPASLDRRVLGDVLEQTAGSEKVSRFLQIRRAMAKTSTAKYGKMLECVGSDDRIRGLTQFYGAGRTGRWAGRLVQMQNLSKNKMPDADLDLARGLVRDGDLEALQMLYDPADALSELVRTSFIPRPGCKFIVSDFSAIEARVLAWMAGEKWRMDVFKGSGKIYEASAEQMFGLPPGSVKKGDPMRQKGKIAELALGYGGSVGALKAMGALDMGLTENELKPLVDSWRSANRQITKFWWAVDKAATRCIEYGDRKSRKGSGWAVGQKYEVYHDGELIGRTSAVSEEQAANNVRHQRHTAGEGEHYDDGGWEAVLVGPPGCQIRFRMEGMYMKVLLPSGRELSYVKPKLDPEDGSITFEGMVQAGGWGRQQTYGPKLVENIIQAVSRDCLAESMKRLEAAGIPIVFHVHDEVICEVPEIGTTFYADGKPYYAIGTWTADQVAEIMGRPIEWAPGLPLRADAYECEYYRKD